YPPMTYRNDTPQLQPPHPTPHFPYTTLFRSTHTSALKNPIRRTTLLNQRSNRTTSISHHRTNLRIRLQQRRHIRNKPIHTLTSLIKFHMPQTIITLPSKRNRRPLHVRRDLNTEREPVNSNRKLIPSIKPQLSRNHSGRTSSIPNA